MSRPGESSPKARESGAPPIPGRSAPQADPPRRTGPLETLFQEAIRRAAAVGLSGFFLTEEAVRRALNDAVPEDWVNYLSEQSTEIRNELIDRLVEVFGNWLHTLDLPAVLSSVLEEHEFSAKIDLSVRRKQEDSSGSVQALSPQK